MAVMGLAAIGVPIEPWGGGFLPGVEVMGDGATTSDTAVLSSPVGSSCRRSAGIRGGVTGGIASIRIISRGWWTRNTPALRDPVTESSVSSRPIRHAACSWSTARRKSHHLNGPHVHLQNHVTLERQAARNRRRVAVEDTGHAPGGPGASAPQSTPHATLPASSAKLALVLFKTLEAGARRLQEVIAHGREDAQLRHT